MRRASPQAGFTLVELMIVVVLVGVLLAVAVSTGGDRPRPFDGAQSAAAMVREAARKALEGGEVRRDVATPVTDGPGARTRMVISTAADNLISVRVDLRVEDPAPATTAQWVLLSTRALARNFTVAGWSNQAELTDGSLPETSLAAGEVVTVYCYPDGTCDGTTVYFASRTRLARLVIMPLGGAPATFATW